MTTNTTGHVTLGDRVRDKITTLEGIAVCLTFWLNGCTRVGIQPVGLHDGKALDVQHTDVAQVEVLETVDSATRKLAVAGGKENPGGPQQDDKRSGL